jgi:mannosyltransferase
MSGAKDAVTAPGDPAVLPWPPGSAPGRDQHDPGRYQAGPVWLRLVPSLVMVALGLWRITGPSYWRDEAATLTAVDRSFGQLLAMLGQVDAVHGVYYLVMWPVVAVAGSGEVVTRLPSVLGMAIAAGMVAALGRRLASVPAGLAAGLVFALLPQISRYAQDARSYGMVAALATAASYLLIRAIGTAGPRRWWLAGYAACLGLMGALDVFTLLLIVAHAVTVALAWRRSGPGRERWALAWGWLTAITAAVVLASPILVLGYEQRSTLKWLQKDRGLHALAKLGRITGPLPLLVALGAVLAVALLAGRWPGRGGLRAVWPGPLAGLCLPWLILPAVILISVSFVSPVFTGRYVLYCLPALALLAGAGLVAAARTLKTIAERQAGAGLSAPGWLAAATVLAIIALLGLRTQLSVRAPGGHGDDIRRADHIVAAHYQPGDAVVYRGIDAKHFPAAYPYGLVQLSAIARDQTPAQADNLAGTMVSLAAVRARLARVSRVWLVGTAGYPSVRVFGARGLTRIRAWRVGAIWLVLYRRGPG